MQLRVKPSAWITTGALARLNSFHRTNPNLIQRLMVEGTSVASLYASILCLLTNMLFRQQSFGAIVALRKSHSRALACALEYQIQTGSALLPNTRNF
jgi:hypothetical protein